MFKLSEYKQKLLKETKNLLVLGGPGAGKTTIALLKAQREVTEIGLKNGQKVLFLSFARATIARVEQQLSTMGIDREVKKQIDVNTYHGFIWNILKSHAYLLTPNTPVKLLPPPEAASLLAEFNPEDRHKEKRRLFFEEGILHFDMFATLCAELLSQSRNLTKIISDVYPTIILDEFQDTNKAEWDFIQELGKRSRLIALADPEQRIYEFRGADPARIGEYIEKFSPAEYDFGSENNRSNGTDILKFGNDLLKGAVHNNTYNDVNVVRYPLRRGGDVLLHVKTNLLQRMGQLKKNSDGWSIAILVPTKIQMLNVSKYLLAKQSFVNGTVLPSLNHEVSLETAGPSLAAVLIAGLMEKGVADLEISNRLIRALCDHIKGRNGDKPASKTNVAITEAYIKYIDTGKITGSNRKATIEECLRISKECEKIELKGSPGDDWIMIRNLLNSSSAPQIKQVADDAQYLRLLHKGSVLNSGLSELWRIGGNYRGAMNLVQTALLQEHFNNSLKEWKGIHVMNMHKAKGKEFDEVIIFEEPYRGIVWNNATKKEIDQARLTLRMAVTRAMKRTTILTPAQQPCVFL